MLPFVLYISSEPIRWVWITSEVDDWEFIVLAFLNYLKKK